jgi:hypothetical protein
MFDCVHSDRMSSGSEPMSLVQLIIPLEVAHDAITELGQLGDVQFSDVSCIVL